jgi:energy-coupling factor transporter ATP-binding protein EcfA2
MLVIFPSFISGKIELDKNERIALLGKNGSGKTTLIRSILCDGNSNIFVDNEDFCKKKDYSKLSAVLQEPYTQILAETFSEEIAIIKRYHKINLDIARKLMYGYFDKKFVQLSDGYKKRYVISSILISNPEYILFDEPFANLDKYSIEIVRGILPLGSLIAEHRTKEVRDFVDRVYLIVDNSVKEIEKEKLFDENFLKENGLRGFRLKKEEDQQLGDTILDTIINNINVKLREKEVLCIVGRNGIGKTTLLKKLVSKAYVIFQNPDLQFFYTTVRDEVKNEYALELFKLKDKADKSPYALSYGEKMRVLIASAFSSKSKIIALDEPSAGMDGYSLLSFYEMIKILKNENRGIIIATHDDDLIGICDNIINLEDLQIGQ